MFVRLVRFNLGPGARDTADEFVAAVVPTIRQQPGLERVTFFGNDSDGEYGLFVLWDSVEHADAAAAVVGPRLQGALSGNAKAPPDIRLFEVIE